MIQGPIKGKNRVWGSGKGSMIQGSLRLNQW